MFIIFGWEKIIKLIESLLTTYCYHCKRDTKWNVWKETEWVSLFFIKIFPFISKHHISCEVCGDSIKLKADFSKKVLNPKFRNTKTHDELVKLLEEHQFSGLTEGQIIYRKSARINNGNNN